MSLWEFFSGPSESANRDPFDDFWYFPIRSKSASGIDVDVDVALTCSAVWAATRLLCIGSVLPFNKYRSRKGGGADVATDDPVQLLIHSQPNDEMGTTLWRASRTAQQINSGNSYSEILRDVRGVPQGIVPIHCNRVCPMRDKSSGTLYYRVRNDDTTHSDIPQEDILHVTSIMSDDGIVGKGVVTFARETIGASLATERQGAAYFKNSARPAYAIIGGTFKDDAAREYYRKTWVKIHGDLENNGTPAMLPTGADLRPLGFSQEDSQFILTRQHDVEEISRWYGTPPHMIQHLLRATLNNIEHQGIEFVVYSLLPWLKLWEDACNIKLLTKEERRQGYFVKHNVEGLLRGDRAARALFYEALWKMGVMSINEIRDKEDMNPIGPDGDKRFVQTSYATIDKISDGSQPKGIHMVQVVPSKTSGMMANKTRSVSAMLKDYLSDSSLKVEGVGERMGGIENVANDVSDRLASLEQQTRLEFDSLRSVIDRAPLNGKSREATECAGRLLQSTVGRMLNKESRAAESAAKNNKSFSQFVDWLDGYYAEYRGTFIEVVSGYVEMLLLAKHDARDPQSVASDLADQHIAASRESILQATEVQPDRWCDVAGRIHASGEEWQQTRTEVAI